MERVAFRTSFLISNARAESIILSVMSVAATLISASIVSTLLREAYSAGNLDISKYFNYIAYRECLNPTEWWHWFRKNPEGNIGNGKKVSGGRAMGRRIVLAILLKMLILSAQVAVNLLVSYRDGQVYLRDIGAVAVFGNVTEYSIDTGDCLLDVPHGGRATLTGVVGICIQGDESIAPPDKIVLSRTKTGMVFSLSRTDSPPEEFTLKAVLYANREYGILLNNSISQEGVNRLRAAILAQCSEIVGPDIGNASLVGCEKPITKRSLLEVGRTISVIPDLTKDIVNVAPSDELIQPNNDVIGTYATTLVWHGTLFVVVGFLVAVYLIVVIVTRGNVQRVINNILIEAAECVSSANYAEIESGKVEIVLSKLETAERGHVGIRVPDGFCKGDPQGYPVV